MKNTLCRPPKGSTYLTIGQDLFSISEYLESQYNASLHRGSLAPMSDFAPAAAMVYTDIETLQGLNSPTDYGSGIEYADGIIDSLFPMSAVGLQIGLWINGTYGCNKINSGEMDDQIKNLKKYLENCKASKIFLRVGYEFDNPFFGFSSDPGSYVKAYQRIVNGLRGKAPSKVSQKVNFVWHSWGAPRAEGVSLEQFYPGEDYVDWIGISIFQQVFPWPSGWSDGVHDWGGSMNDVEEVLNFAADNEKPTMIAESTPFGGINLNTTKTRGYNETDPWDRWYGKVYELIEKYDISMFSYINCNWEAQPMWHDVGFGDTRLSTSERVMEKWREQILQSNGKQKFLMAGSLGNCGLQDVSDGVTLVSGTWVVSNVTIFIILTCLCLGGIIYFISKLFQRKSITLERSPLIIRPDVN